MQFLISVLVVLTFSSLSCFLVEIRHNACNGCLVVFYLGETKKQNMNWQKYFDDDAVIKLSFFQQIMQQKSQWRIRIQALFP